MQEGLSNLHLEHADLWMYLDEVWNRLPNRDWVEIRHVKGHSTRADARAQEVTWEEKTLNDAVDDLAKHRVVVV